MRLHSRNCWMVVLLSMSALAASPKIINTQKNGTQGGPVSSAYEDFVEPWRTRFVQRWQQATEIAEKEMKNAQGRARKAGSDQERKAASAQVKAAKQRLERLRENNPPYLGELRVGGLAVGAFGCPEMIDAKVMQVIDTDRMLVGVDDARAGNGRYDTWIMLKAPTAGITDGKFWRSWDHLIGKEGILHVSGTMKYETTVGGTKTVLVVESLNVETLKKHQ